MQMLQSLSNPWAFPQTETRETSDLYQTMHVVLSLRGSKPPEGLSSGSALQKRFECGPKRASHCARGAKLNSYSSKLALYRES